MEWLSLRRHSNNKHKLLIILLLIGIPIFLALGKLPFAVIFFLLWVDKIISGYTKGALSELGIELVTVPTIYIGILYGSIFAFLFCFLVYPILNAIKWVIAQPLTTELPPFIPSPDTFIDGMIGFMAGILPGLLPLPMLFIVCVIAKNILISIKDAWFFGMPPKPMALINIIANVFLANYLIFILQM